MPTSAAATITDTTDAAAALADNPRHRAHSILQRAVCVTLERHYLGNDRKVAVSDVIKEAIGEEGEKASDRKVAKLEEQVRASIKLIDRRKLHPVMRKIGEAGVVLRSLAIPTHRVFGERTYLIALEGIERAEVELKRVAEELEFEATKLADVYEDAKETQRKALGGLFDAKNYKTAREVRDAFRIDWSYVSFAAPERLEHVNSALFAKAQQKYESKMAEAYDEVRAVLREALSQLVAKIIIKLTPDPDGKPRVFRDTVLTGLTDYLSTFSFRNIADDSELQGVVAKLRKLTRNLDPQTLRDADATRAHVLREMQKADAQLDKLIRVGGRAITFDDDLGGS